MGILKKGLKPQQFTYKPRHFNPLLDDLHQRLGLGKYAVDEKGANKAELMKERLRKSMKGSALRNRRNKKKALFSANLRWVAILALLIVGTYYLFAIYFPKLEAWLGTV